MARCRFVTPDTVRLPLSDGDWIEVKKELNAGERRRIFSGLVKSMHSGEKPNLDPEQVGKTQLVEYIVAWSFLDSAGKSAPFSADALDKLDPESYAELVKAVDAHDTRVEEAQAARKNSQGGANASSAISPSAG